MDYGLTCKTIKSSEKKKNRRKSLGSMGKQRVLILEVQKENLISGSFIEILKAFVL